MFYATHCALPRDMAMNKIHMFSMIMNYCYSIASNTHTQAFWNFMCIHINIHIYIWNTLQYIFMHLIYNHICNHIYIFILCPNLFLPTSLRIKTSMLFLFLIPINYKFSNCKFILKITILTIFVATVNYMQHFQFVM